MDKSLAIPESSPLDSHIAVSDFDDIWRGNCLLFHLLIYQEQQSINKTFLGSIQPDLVFDAWNSSN